jgi:outer membrane PBP1 activator LpoA protein
MKQASQLPSRKQKKTIEQKMSEDSKYAHRVEDAEEHRQKRLNLTEQEKHLQQLVDTEAHRRKREKLGEQEKEKRAENYRKAQEARPVLEDFNSILDKNGIPKPVSETLKNKIVQNCKQELGKGGFHCLSCAQYLFQEPVEQRYENGSPFWKSLKTQLRAPDNLPKRLVQCYDVSERETSLAGILLCREGIRTTNRAHERTCSARNVTSILQTKDDITHLQ